jgi:hypothetical protein
MDSLPVNNNTVGEPESTQNKILETGASAVQVCFINHMQPLTILTDIRTLRQFREFVLT